MKRWQSDPTQPSLPQLNERLVVAEDVNAVPSRTVTREPCSDVQRRCDDSPQVAEVRARLRASIAEYLADQRNRPHGSRR